MEQHHAPKTPATPLPCSRCELPTARIENGCLTIQAKHHGETHRVAYSFETLRRMMSEAEGQQTKAAGAK